jgi:hypothetical protein
VKSHNITVSARGEVVERKVDGTERFILKSGSDLRSWKVQELTHVSVEPGYDDEQVAALVCDQRGGMYHHLRRGATITLGEDSWTAADIESLVLGPIPARDEAPPPPYEPGTWTVHHNDGTAQLLYGVVRFEDMSGYVWSEDGYPRVAVPPPELVEASS